VGEKITLQILHIVKQPSNHAGCFSSMGFFLCYDGDMSENPEKNNESFSEEQEEVINEWMAKYATEEIPAEKRRECGPEIEELEGMFESFEQTYDFAALHAVTNLTPAEAPHHPVREPAKQALNPIYKKLQLIKDETNVTPEKYAELKVKWKRLSQAVGMINNNVVDHTER
jgi:hypothetical protein